MPIPMHSRLRQPQLLCSFGLTEPSSFESLNSLGTLSVSGFPLKRVILCQQAGYEKLHSLECV